MRNLRIILIGLALAMMAIVGGYAGATIPHSTTGVITGCYHNNTGSLRVINAESGARCSGNETQLPWNQTGPQGPPGITGAQVVTSKWNADVSPPPPVTEDNRHSLFVRAICPSGMVATGGGGLNDEADPEQFIIKESSPTLAEGVPRGWEVEFGYLGPVPYSNADLFAMAVCAPAS